jgi:hypothetical protein
MKTSVKISGITFIKNGLTLGYPILESIKSIDPLVDEVIINVGFEDIELSKDDGTYEYLKTNLQGPKYVFLKSWWDPKISQSGKILAQQTDIALAAAKGEFIQYIQGDEVIHEDDLDLIRSGIAQMEKDSSIDGLIFKYLHFYGNSDTIKYTRNVYRREVRVIRNNQIKSWRDAQGFRYLDDQKIPCKQISARIFHYGWARPQSLMDKKTKEFVKLYHGAESKSEDFSYKRCYGLKKFKGSHPKIMKDWILKNSNQINIEKLKPHFEWKDLSLFLSDLVEKISGYRIGEYKNFKVIK